MRDPLRKTWLGVLAFAACVGGSSIAAAETFEVTMGEDDLFHPALLTIAPGDSVTWRNQDQDAHTSTGGGSDCTSDGSWDSGDVLPGASWGRVFDTIGTFDYFCRYHCFMGMVGRVVVSPDTPVEPRSWAKVKATYR